jgi:hypothetical protein
VTSVPSPPARRLPIEGLGRVGRGGRGTGGEERGVIGKRRKG